MKKRTKIVHIVEAFGGGVYNFLVELLNYTINYYDVTVIYSVRTQTPKDFKKDFDSRIKFIESKYMTRNIGINDLKACFEVKKLINSENPDIVHCHSSKAGFISRIIINTKKIKTFYTPHGYSFLMKDCSLPKRLVYKFIEKIGTLNHSTIIACSKGEYEESLKLTKRAVYINNGVNLEKLRKYISNDTRKIDTKNLVISTIGRISYQKNPRLFNQISQNFPDIEFIWIGMGELEKELSSKNIKITGWKNREEVMKILSETDIFILPSLWEGLPISLLEAMAVKKVCIVSNVIGNKDVIVNGENGFVCDDLDEFINVIENIKKGKYDLKKISQNAFDSIRKIYNTDVMNKEYLELYSKDI